METQLQFLVKSDIKHIICRFTVLYYIILYNRNKIQIIDAPVLPRVTVNRKRKSLDNNKEPSDKKKVDDFIYDIMPV